MIASPPSDDDLREYYPRGLTSPVISGFGVPVPDDAPKPAATAGDLGELIAAAAYRSTTERDMQDGILRRLLEAGYTVNAEHRFDARDRIDFLVDGVGIEVKIGGSREALVRQLIRYAEHDEISELLVITTRARHHGVPEVLGGKPVHLVQIGGIL